MRKSYKDLPLDSKCSCGCGENVALRKSNDKTKVIVQSHLSRRCMGIMQRYGMSYTERQALWESQNKLCKCCGKEVAWLDGPTAPGDRGVRAVVDHCHQGGQVRGILCVACNMSLGNVEDNIETLQKMILYLKGELRG